MKENNRESALMTVSEKLRNQPSFDRSFFDSSLVEYFAKKLENFRYKTGEFVRFGADSIALELEGNKMLKIFGGKKPNDDKGTRPFDLPILEQGEFEKEETQEFPNDGYYIIQPKADTNVSFEETRKFIEGVKKMGYKDVDIGHEGNKQLGYFNGKLYLLDYDAVQ